MYAGMTIFFYAGLDFFVKRASGKIDDFAGTILINFFSVLPALIIYFWLKVSNQEILFTRDGAVASILAGLSIGVGTITLLKMFSLGTNISLGSPVVRIGTVMMTKQLLRDGLGWGFLLWLVGYVLGIILFMMVPVSMVGWVITPIGTAMTLWVLFKKVKGNNFKYYLLIAIIWTLVAIIFDFFFLVKLFKPADGYYKLDVYLYYMLTFSLPLIVGYRKSQLNKS